MFLCLIEKVGKIEGGPIAQSNSAITGAHAWVIPGGAPVIAIPKGMKRTVRDDYGRFSDVATAMPTT